jgi:hypothetical protein
MPWSWGYRAATPSTPPTDRGALLWRRTARDPATAGCGSSATPAQPLVGLAELTGPGGGGIGPAHAEVDRWRQTDGRPRGAPRDHAAPATSAPRGGHGPPPGVVGGAALPSCVAGAHRGQRHPARRPLHWAWLTKPCGFAARRPLVPAPDTATTGDSWRFRLERGTAIACDAGVLSLPSSTYVALLARRPTPSPTAVATIVGLSRSRHERHRAPICQDDPRHPRGSSHNLLGGDDRHPPTVRIDQRRYGSRLRRGRAGVSPPRPPPSPGSMRAAACASLPAVPGHPAASIPSPSAARRATPPVRRWPSPCGSSSSPATGPRWSWP